MYVVKQWSAQYVGWRVGTIRCKSTSGSNAYPSARYTRSRTFTGGRWRLL